MIPVCRSLMGDAGHCRCFSTGGYNQTPSFCLIARRFLITAPRVFRVGVNEKVFVQMGAAHLNTEVTLYLEDESGIVVSEQKTVLCTEESGTKEKELMVWRENGSAHTRAHRGRHGRLEPCHLPLKQIDEEMMSTLIRSRGQMPHYLNLMASSSTFQRRKSTRVRVLNRRGHIFIQTDQPIYNPMQPGRKNKLTVNMQ